MKNFFGNHIVCDWIAGSIWNSPNYSIWISELISNNLMTSFVYSFHFLLLPLLPPCHIQLWGICYLSIYTIFFLLQNPLPFLHLFTLFFFFFPTFSRHYNYASLNPVFGILVQYVQNLQLKGTNTQAQRNVYMTKTCSKRVIFSLIKIMHNHSKC